MAQHLAPDPPRAASRDNGATSRSTGRLAELGCAWSGLVGLAVALAGFVLARFLPLPPKANDTPTEVVHYYVQHLTSIRVGLMLASLGVCLVGPLLALITLQMWRIARGGSPVLAILAAITGAVTWVMLLVPMIVLEVAAFRPGRNPETTQALHDLGWILFLTPVGPFALQGLVIAAAILTDDREEPLLPRWLGYLNIWVALSFVPALLAYFFKSGPFAWHGVFVFYFGVVFYGLWMLIMSVQLRASVLRWHAGLGPNGGEATVAHRARLPASTTS
jgi:hypothetical protein